MSNKEELTEEEKAKVFAAQLQYYNALKSQDQAGIKRAKEYLHKVKVEIFRSKASL